MIPFSRPAPACPDHLTPRYKKAAVLAAWALGLGEKIIFTSGPPPGAESGDEPEVNFTFSAAPEEGYKKTGQGGRQGA